MAALRPLATVLVLTTTLATASHAAAAGPAPEAPARALHAGDVAPDFTYRSHDGRVLAFRDLLAQGDLLLVFEPDERTLARLEDQRDELLALGVLPVGVLDRRDGDVLDTVNRLGLDYSVMSDPRRTVASLYGAVDPGTGRTAKAWVVVDRHGRVSALGHDALPPRVDWTALVAAALHRAAPGTPLDASTH